MLYKGVAVVKVNDNYSISYEVKKSLVSLAISLTDIYHTVNLMVI